MAAPTILPSSVFGDQGWVRVDRHGAGHPGLVASDDALLEIKLRADDRRLYNSQNHVSNFLECARSRMDPISDVDATHTASYLGLLTEVAGRLEQKLEWDPKRERFVGNDEANRLLHRTMRNGWQL